MIKLKVFTSKTFYRTAPPAGSFDKNKQKNITGGIIYSLKSVNFSEIIRHK